MGHVTELVSVRRCREHSPVCVPAAALDEGHAVNWLFFSEITSLCGQNYCQRKTEILFQ